MRDGLFQQAIKVMQALSLVAGWSILAPDQSDAQELRAVMPGNHIESFRIVVDGPLEDGFTERFERFLKNEPSAAMIVAFNSPGGSLVEGIKLGRAIRRNGLWTTVEEIGPTDLGESIVSGGVCASACAYAFLGGEVRRLYPTSRLGFHRFYRGGSLDEMLSHQAPESEISANAQIASALIIQYLHELGDVSPNVLLLAASTPPESMYWVSLDEAQDLDIITTFRWSRFWLEPYRGGVVAAARREGATDGYDALYAYMRVAQATAFCRGGTDYLMLSLPSRLDIDPELFPVEWSFEGLGGDKVDIIRQGKYILRGDETQGWIDIPLDSEVLGLLHNARQFSVQISAPRSAGWNFRFDYELEPMDRSMLEAAHRFCIE